MSPQIWLEAYLTNGRISQSNVVEFQSLSSAPQTLPALGQEVEKASAGDYYSSMVAAAIVATFALMGLAVVLYFYLRRHTTYKVGKYRNTEIRLLPQLKNPFYSYS